MKEILFWSAIGGIVGIQIVKLLILRIEEKINKSSLNEFLTKGTIPEESVARKYRGLSQLNFGLSALSIVLVVAVGLIQFGLVK